MKLGILRLFGRARTYFVFICNIWSARALYSNFKILTRVHVVRREQQRGILDFASNRLLDYLLTV